MIFLPFQKLAGERVVVDNKNLCRQGFAPVANAIPVRLRHGNKPKNLSAAFSSLAASGLVLLEAVESQLVSKDTLCSLPSGSAPAPPPGRVPSRQSRGFHASPFFGASRRGGRGHRLYRD